MSDLEIVERQNVIIKLQSNIIDDLFLQLMNYVSVDEVENLDVVRKINSAIDLMGKIGGQTDVEKSQ